jgi:hypothetical protein
MQRLTRPRRVQTNHHYTQQITIPDNQLDMIPTTQPGMKQIMQLDMSQDTMLKILDIMAGDIVVDIIQTSGAGENALVFILA